MSGPGAAGLLAGIVAVAAGNNFSLALKADGTVWAWGFNGAGQLGDGTQTDRLAPVQVQGPGGAGNLTDVIAIAAGGYVSLALKSDGTVWSWGGPVTPVQVTGLANVIAIARGSAHSLALKSDGTVWADRKSVV